MASFISYLYYKLYTEYVRVKSKSSSIYPITKKLNIETNGGIRIDGKVHYLFIKIRRVPEEEINKFRMEGRPQGPLQR